jgi:hypothetical protein
MHNPEQRIKRPRITRVRRPAIGRDVKVEALNGRVCDETISASKLRSQRNADRTGADSPDSAFHCHVDDLKYHDEIAARHGSIALSGQLKTSLRNQLDSVVTLAMIDPEMSFLDRFEDAAAVAFKEIVAAISSDDLLEIDPLLLLIDESDSLEEFIETILRVISRERGFLMAASFFICNSANLPRFSSAAMPGEGPSSATDLVDLPDWFVAHFNLSLTLRPDGRRKADYAIQAIWEGRWRVAESLDNERFALRSDIDRLMRESGGDGVRLSNGRMEPSERTKAKSVNLAEAVTAVLTDSDKPVSLAMARSILNEMMSRNLAKEVLDIDWIKAGKACGLGSNERKVLKKRAAGEATSRDNPAAWKAINRKIDKGILRQAIEKTARERLVASESISDGSLRGLVYTELVNGRPVWALAGDIGPNDPLNPSGFNLDASLSDAIEPAFTPETLSIELPSMRFLDARRRSK